MSDELTPMQRVQANLISFMGRDNVRYWGCKEIVARQLAAELEQSQRNESRASGMLKQACEELEQVKKELSDSKLIAAELFSLLEALPVEVRAKHIDLSKLTAGREILDQRDEARRIADGLANALSHGKQDLILDRLSLAKPALAAYTESKKGWK